MQNKLSHFIIRFVYSCGIVFLTISIESCYRGNHKIKSAFNIQKIENIIKQQKQLAKDPIKALSIVKSLKVDATQNDIQTTLKKFTTECSHATRRDLPQIYESLKLLRQQKNAVKAFINYYNSTPREDYISRLFTLMLFGELQRKDALPFLKIVAWASLPSEIISVQIDVISPRAYEEMIQSKAVQCIAFIRNDNATLNDEAERETYRVIKNHTSMHVRICAIDALMWNHGDSRAIADSLYKILPEKFHKYVERPRFYLGANKKVFNERLAEWRSRWGKH